MRGAPSILREGIRGPRSPEAVENLLLRAIIGGRSFNKDQSSAVNSSVGIQPQVSVYRGFGQHMLPTRIIVCRGDGCAVPSSGFSGHYPD